MFTTRPDTLFGATYCVVAPEHALLRSIVTPGQRAVVDGYVRSVERLGEAERSDAGREKTGVFTGAFVINPANGGAPAGLGRRLRAGRLRRRGHHGGPWP